MNRQLKGRTSRYTADEIAKMKAEEKREDYIDEHTEIVSKYLILHTDKDSIEWLVKEYGIDRDKIQALLDDMNYSTKEIAEQILRLVVS